MYAFAFGMILSIYVLKLSRLEVPIFRLLVPSTKASSMAWWLPQSCRGGYGEDKSKEYSCCNVMAVSRDVHGSILSSLESGAA